MKIFCNQSEFLPKELKELFEINGFLIEDYNPQELNISKYYKEHVEGSSEIHIFFCFINYVQYSDLSQFPFLKNEVWNDQIKLIAVFNDTHETFRDIHQYINIVDSHYLSDPHFALIQKIKLQISNFENHKIWGVKVLVLDHDISQLKIMHQILSSHSLLSICCSNAFEATKYLNKQVKLIIVSETFALHKKFAEFLIDIDYNRNKICILDQGSKDVIHQIRANGYFTIFERPLKLENFIHIVLQNIRSTTTSIIKKKKSDIESVFLPVHTLAIEEDKNIENLIVAEDYIYRQPSDGLENKKYAVISKESPLNNDNIINIRLELEKALFHHQDEQESGSRIRIKKNEEFYKYAQHKLKWLLDDLFVNIAQLQNFPKKVPDHWFMFYQKDLRKAIMSPMVLIQFLTFELYNKREYIFQCLNASIICSQMLMKAIPNEFGEWPEKMEEEWEFKQKDHQLLMKLSLCIRHDLYQAISNHSFTDIENVLELNKTEADILMGFQWVTPYESTYENANLARILKIVHRYICLSTGIHSKRFNEEPISSQEICFRILFEEANPQYRLEEIRDLLFTLKMWSLWQYHEEIIEIRKFPCMLARDIHVSYKPVKIECNNYRRAPEFMHLEFCKGCLSHFNNSDLDREAYYCRSGNEKLMPLAKKIFGPDADYEGFYDPEINKSKKNNLL